MVNGMAGKGDTPRPVDIQKYSDNYDRIFGMKPERWLTVGEQQKLALKMATPKSKQKRYAFQKPGNKLQKYDPVYAKYFKGKRISYGFIFFKMSLVKGQLTCKCGEITWFTHSDIMEIQCPKCKKNYNMHGHFYLTEIK